MARRYIEIRGRAKTWVAVAVLAVVAWSFFGRGFFDFNFGYFSQGYQASFLRGGHFERHGRHWQQQDVTLGHIVSLGGERLVIDVDARLRRGAAVIHVWRWPAFLYDAPGIHRRRIEDTLNERLVVRLDRAGLYVLSTSGAYLGGDLSVDWRAGAPAAAD